MTIFTGSEIQMSTAAILIWLILINLLGFGAMGIDKYLATKQQRRIPEQRFIVMAIIGAALGIIVGMKLFRHKTKHLKFTIGIPVLAVVNIAVYTAVSWYF